MLFIYQPQGVETPKQWDFAGTRLMNMEAEAIERVTKQTFSEWEDRLQRGGILEQRALLWVLLRRDQPGLKFDQVQFAAGDVRLELDDAESAAALKELDRRAADGEDFDDQTQALHQALRDHAAAGILSDLDEEHDDLSEDADQEADAPKASLSDVVSTSGTSPDSSTHLPTSSTD